MRAAIADPGRYAIEPKVDGVRGLVAFAPGGHLETRNRRGERRQWLRAQPLAHELRRLGRRLPVLHDGTVLMANSGAREQLRNDGEGHRPRIAGPTFDGLGETAGLYSRPPLRGHRVALRHHWRRTHA